MLEQPEKIDEWKCEKCNESCQAMKQLVPYRFPPILVIHLKASIFPQFKYNLNLFDFWFKIEKVSFNVLITYILKSLSKYKTYNKVISAIRVKHDQYAMDEMLATH